jgi:hypothetical protein
MTSLGSFGHAPTTGCWPLLLSQQLFNSHVPVTYKTETQLALGRRQSGEPSLGTHPFCGAEASNGSSSIPDQKGEDSNVELHYDVTSTCDY